MNERTMIEQYVSIKKMSDMKARRFRLTAKEFGFTAATLMTEYNPVPYLAVKRHLSAASLARNNDRLWECHTNMADFFLMIQKQGH